MRRGPRIITGLSNVLSQHAEGTVCMDQADLYTDTFKFAYMYMKRHPLKVDVG